MSTKKELEITRKERLVREWAEEFCPLPANGPSLSNDVSAIEFSIHKWKGLRKDVLKRCHLEPRDTRDYTSGNTCPLCVMHSKIDVGGISTSCLTCPLSIVRGCTCSEINPGNAEGFQKAPYFQWIDDGNPEPMIALLEEALAWTKENYNG